MLCKKQQYVNFGLPILLKQIEILDQVGMESRSSCPSPAARGPRQVLHGNPADPSPVHHTIALNKRVAGVRAMKFAHPELAEVPLELQDRSVGCSVCGHILPCSLVDGVVCCEKERPQGKSSSIFMRWTAPGGCNREVGPKGAAKGHGSGP